MFSLKELRCTDRVEPEQETLGLVGNYVSVVRSLGSLSNAFGSGCEVDSDKRAPNLPDG